MPQKKAQIILEVAQAIGTQLEMGDLLAALHNTLKPIVPFDAISILILKGETSIQIILSASWRWAGRHSTRISSNYEEVPRFLS